MSFEPRRKIPGLDPEAERALCEVQTAIARECKRIEKSAQRPKRRCTELVEEGTVIAQPGEVVRVQPGDEDVTVVLPEPSAASDGEDIVISFEGDGAAVGKVQVVPASGTCLLPGVQTLNAPGTYRFTSTGGGATPKPRSNVVPVDTSAPRGGVWSGPPPITTDDLPPIDTSELVEDSVDNTILDEMPANSVKVNATSGVANPTDLAIPANTVLGRKSGDIVAEQVATAQIGDNQVTNAKIRQSAAMSVVARATNTAGDVADIAMPVTTGGRFLRTNTTGFPSTNPVAPSLIGWGVVTLLDLPILLNNRFLANVSGVDASPLGVDFFFVADGSRGVEWDPTDQVFFVKTTVTLFIHTDGTVQREAIAGDVVIPQFSNTATIQANVVLDTMLRDSGALSVIGRSANSSGDPADISAVAGSGAVLRESGSVLGFGTVATAGLADDSVTNAKLAEMVANTVKANATSGTANPTDFAVGTNTVLGRVAGDIVAAQLVNAQITDGTIANAKLANMTAGTVKGRQIDAATGVPVDLTGAEVVELLRVSTVQTESGAMPLAITLNADTTLLSIASSGDGDIRTITGSTLGRLVFVLIFAASGVKTLKHNFSAGTSSALICPGLVDTTARVRDAFWLVGLGADGWEVVRSRIGTSELLDDAITDAKLRNSGALSVIGRSANSSGDPADISAVAASGAVLRESGSTLGFGTIATAGLADDSVTDAKLRNSAALSVIGRSANSSGDPADIAAANDGEVLRRSGTALGFGTVATAGLADDSVTNAKLANMAAGTVKGRVVTAGTGDPVDLTGAQTSALLRYAWLTDTTSTGTVTSYAPTGFAADTTGIRVSPAGNLTLRGMALADGQMLAIRVGRGTANTVTLNHEDASANANEAFNCPGNANITLRAGEAVLIRYVESRCNVIGTGRFSVADNDYGDITVSSVGTVWTIDNNTVSNAKLRDSGALSVIGRSANSTGDPADISATAGADAVLRESGSVLGFGTVATGGLANNAVTNGKLRSSSQLSVIGRSANSVGDPADIVATGSDQVLRESAGTIGWGTIATGGLANNAVTDAKLRQGTALTVIGRSANSTGNVADIAAANDGEVLRRSGTALGFGTVATAGITDAAVTLAKMADLAQSRIVGRAESAGTGVPTALTPTQVVAIIDGEAVTWTGSHTFNGSNFTVTAGADVGITASGGTVTLAATTQVQITSPTRLASSVRLDSVGSTAATAANDLAINSVNVVRFTGGMDPLTGMVPVVDGQTVLLVNAHASVNMGIHIESGSSSAANRFAGIGTSRVIRPGEMALAWYDGADDRWRLLLRDEVDL